VLANIKPPPTEIPKPPLPQPPTHTNKPSELEVARVADELVVIPPQEITASAPTANPLDSAKTGSGSETDSLLNTKSDPKTDKRSILSRLNPFGGRPKSASKEKTEASLEGTSPGTSGGDGSSVIVAARSPSPPMAPRYTYVSPLRPSTGNRREAERFFNDGIKAQQAGKPALALAAYKKATQLDPSYFEAFYNQGLAAYALGNWKESLSDYEYALAIKPDSIDARYNFALALQQANYPQDASFELLEILNENPNETRAHLLLANLYARQLSESKLARQHYLKVLELDSRHPKAAEIRYWLAANP
jgi:tetratricopeptide (TPR) repeat protein